jgi:hypothetical protein
LPLHRKSASKLRTVSGYRQRLGVIEIRVRAGTTCSADRRRLPPFVAGNADRRRHKNHLPDPLRRPRQVGKIIARAHSSRRVCRTIRQGPLCRACSVVRAATPSGKGATRGRCHHSATAIFGRPSETECRDLRGGSGIERSRSGHHEWCGTRAAAGGGAARVVRRQPHALAGRVAAIRREFLVAHGTQFSEVVLFAERSDAGSGEQRCGAHTP